jgi:hypothetical protein
MGLADAIKILEILAPIAEAIPVLGTPVKAALEATSKILDYAKARARLAGEAGSNQLTLPNSKQKITRSRRQGSRSRRHDGSKCS